MEKFKLIGSNFFFIHSENLERAIKIYLRECQLIIRTRKQLKRKTLFKIQILNMKSISSKHWEPCTRKAVAKNFIQMNKSRKINQELILKKLYLQPIIGTIKKKISLKSMISNFIDRAFMHSCKNQLLLTLPIAVTKKVTQSPGYSFKFSELS